MDHSPPAATDDGYVKRDIITYLLNFPASTFDSLYKQPATCLAIFRLLPPLSKQIVMRMLYLHYPLATAEMHSWVREDSIAQMNAALERASKFKILQCDANQWSLHETFRSEFQNALTGRGLQSSFGSLATGSDRHAVDIPFLDNSAKESWEAVLQFMVGTANISSPPLAVLKILEDSHLMKRSSEHGPLVITHHGFQFLLQDINSQVWALLLQYLDLITSGELGMAEVDVLNFLFLLSSMELGAAYSTEVLSDTQKAVLKDMKAFGIVYQRKSKHKRFYPTRLATTLTNGKLAIRHAEGEQDGFILLETNFRLYAYTASSLQISILELFVNISAKFPNFVLGVITRDSILRAVAKGITAEQIIAFLTNNAHPLMRKNSPVLPVTVVDQLRLWEMETKRLHSARGRLFSGFPNAREFDILVEYAKSIDAVLWASRDALSFVVREESYKSIDAFIANTKKRRLERAQIQRDREREAAAAAAAAAGASARPPPPPPQARDDHHQHHHGNHHHHPHPHNPQHQQPPHHHRGSSSHSHSASADRRHQHHAQHQQPLQQPYAPQVPPPNRTHHHHHSAGRPAHGGHHHPQQQHDGVGRPSSHGLPPRPLERPPPPPSQQPQQQPPPPRRLPY
ncbi:RNA polymerase II transcription factor B 52 kDa subunit [Blastocladiella emersonii ATCC 22665]|nr:RNA polymerase II transcription factor B 52 kDa subunit [Blastocladiella emersonii ATCC 22665]